MRTLVVGAGGLGGYFGACLSLLGRDVIYLVRPRRAEQLARGLSVVSPLGDFNVPAKTVLAADLDETFDLVLLCVKAYSLPEVMEQMAPAVGPSTVIIPVLNGLSHIDALQARFGSQVVLGAMAQIGANLDVHGTVIHTRPGHITFGEIEGGTSDRVQALSAFFEGARFTTQASPAIMQDMWEKWTQMSTGAGIGCLMRGDIADIMAAGGHDIVLQLLAECSQVANRAGFPPRAAFTDFAQAFFTDPKSPMKTSLLRDIEIGSITEGDHILGQIAARARALGVITPVLDMARVNIGVYELVRQRVAANSAVA